MPYDTPTVRQRTISGRRQWEFTITGTSIGPSDEVELPIDWSIGKTTHQQVTCSDGSATTCRPGAGKVSGWTPNTNDEAWLTDASIAGLYINDSSEAKFAGAPSRLYWNANVDGAADNTINATVTIMEGHQA